MVGRQKTARLKKKDFAEHFAKTYSKSKEFKRILLFSILRAKRKETGTDRDRVKQNNRKRFFFISIRSPFFILELCLPRINRKWFLGLPF